MTEKQLKYEELLHLFEPVQGSINFYYGRVGNGKTYAATSDIIDLARSGQVVYANWKINIPDYDERKSFLSVINNNLFFHKRFYKFPADNIKYFDPDDIDIEFLSKLANCHVFIDEGQWIFDSYEGTKFSKQKRKLILHTRHYNRTLNIISQRPSAIQVSARGNVERFYKCTKKLSWPFLMFSRTEYQDMIGEMPDENSPVSHKIYFAKKEVMNAYNTLAMRGSDALEQKINFEAWEYNFFGRIKLLFSLMFKSLPLKRKRFNRKLEVKSTGDNSTATTIKKGVGSKLKTPSEDRVMGYTLESRKNFLGGKAKKSLEQTLPF